jgi:hypothetical protein
VALTGGVADKFGNRYEGRWTVACLANVLDDRWTSIALEPEDGFKIEFTGIRADGSAEHHQAKRQAPGDRSWSLALLDREGLLDAMVKWTEPGHEFVFVNGSPVGGGLRGLAEHARLASSFAGFKAGLGEGLESQFAALCKRLKGATDERAWLALARTQFRQMDETGVTELAVARLGYLVDGDPLVVTRLLADYALESVRQQVSATALWRFLEKAGVHRRDWGTDPSVRAAVDNRRERFVRERESSRILGRLFPRAASTELAEMLLGGEHRRVILSAPAGMGKSIAVRDAVELAARKVLVLPFALDHVPAAVEAERLGHALGLPGSPSLVLAHLAGGEQAILVIDQLDAVSQASGRNPEALAAVDEMLRECEDHPNIAVLLVCRGFDLSADPRLRRLRDLPDTKVLELGPLGDDDVDVVLNEIAWEPGRVSSRQRELIRVPLHLRLLAEAPSARAFATELDLFEAYWTAKRDAIVSRGGSDLAAVEVVNRLASEMSARQALVAPTHLVDRWRREAAMLRSEHVVVGEDASLSFFHEKFFDFAFARGFVASGQELVPFLLSTDQGLFRRSQARQILAYRRVADPDAYMQDLHDLLHEPRIRFHIKALVLSWLATVDDPRDREWSVLAELIDSSDEALAAHVVNVIAAAPGIFDRADDAGAIRSWLDDEKQFVRDRAAWVLARVQRHRASRVAEILSLADCGDERVRQRIVFVVRMADLTRDETFFAFFLEVLARGCLDELTSPFAVNGSFWDLAHSLSEKRPAWAASFVATFVRRRMALAAAAGEANPFAGSVPDPIEQDLFTKAAGAAPVEFTAAVLPVVLDIIRATGAKSEHDGRVDDPIWRYRIFGRTHGVETGLIEGLELAIQRLAAMDPEVFAPVREQLIDAGSSTTDHLLARAFAAAADRHSGDAAAWVLAKPIRLAAGYMDADHWVGRELLTAIWPHLDPDARGALEAVLLGYYTRWERSVDGHRSHGHAQFVLLDGLPEDGLSPQAKRRLGEHRRKFGQVHGPRGIVAGWVGSPVPSEKVSRMNDEQWLRAISRYSSEGIRHDRPYEIGGGAHQLASRLREVAKDDPVRFVSLALMLPQDVHPAYPEAVLQALADAEPVPSNLVFDLVRFCDALPGRPCGRYICDAVATHSSDSDIPEDIAELVAWYATSDPDPAPGVEHNFGNQDHGTRMGLLNAGINTDRGRAAHAVARLVAANPASLERWRPVILRMAGDHSDAVRACVAGVLLATLAIDRDWTAAVAQTLFRDRPEVASSHDGERVIRALTFTHPHVTVPLIEVLVSFAHEAAARVGGRLACLASFSTDEAQSMASRALAGSPGARVGAAEVYAANVGDEALRAECAAALTRLFDDPDPKVRREAGTAFRSLRDANLGAEEDLIRAFAESPALRDNPHDILDALLESSYSLPDATYLVCMRVVEIAGGEAGSIASQWSAQMPDVAALAVRLHAYGTPEAQQRALDLIDRLSAVSAYGLDQAIQQFDR